MNRRRDTLHPHEAATALANVARARRELQAILCATKPSCDLYRCASAAHDALTALARVLGEEEPVGGSGPAHRWPGAPKS